MLAAILAIAALAAFFGLLLGYSAIRFRVEGDPIADQIDSLLPQTQCGQCGHPGCRPYAEALAKGEDDVNKCLPGGEALVLALSDLLGREPVAMEVKEKVPSVAMIDPTLCIGCTLCLQACPVDAIIGAAKQLHGVLIDECTGCELCLPPCPVQCIRMRPLTEDIPRWRWPYPGKQPSDTASPVPVRDAA
ncbi:electron transport complex subunit RsxB [Thiocystis violacea]|uniref:electron transport complex subunit RsxB n=1 Tax=Thiocystis violacea TaxID=13725 RepID=UPI001905A316|nr:electron transport complex subunit RsxB [Thiocystis violacea]MBK1717576.1 electron transport complex subunit RsxB [Thiocystis violacea]